VRNGILSAAAVCLLGVPFAHGQAISKPGPDSGISANGLNNFVVVGTASPSAPMTDGAIVISDFSDDCGTADCSSLHRAWITADYLLWWIKSAPQPFPLVTTGDTINQGVPGQPGTAVLLGGDNLELGATSGLRLSAGFWLNREGTIGLEASGLFLARRSKTFEAASDPNGNPLIARPALDADAGNAPIDYVDSFPSGPVFGNPTVTGPAEVAGGVNVNYTVKFNSWEINSLFNLRRTEATQLDLIAGFRALSLREDLKMIDSLTALQSDGFLSFEQTPLNAGDHLADFDEFGTSNHFYGGQIGARLRTTIGAFTLEGTAKVALGGTHEVLNISGATAYTPVGGPTVVVPGGILAQTTNIGQTTHSEFSVVPEIGLNIGYQVTDRLNLHMGYSFLYWSEVLRPGNQINPSVNVFIVPSDPQFGLGTGPAQPSLSVHPSGFWAMGLNFGAEFRF
jgi:hypothetical protein